MAFDGLIADTITARAEAIEETLAGHDIMVSAERIVSALPGRTVSEVLRHVLRPPSVGAPDETLLDVLTMQAQRRCAQRLLQGVPLAPTLTDFVTQFQVRGTAVVVRSDSPRREVEQTLALTGTLGGFRILRCADDPSRDRGGTSLDRSYAEIMRRMVTPGNAGRCAAVEIGEYAGAAARRHVEHVSTLAVQPWAGGRVLESLLPPHTFPA